MFMIQMIPVVLLSNMQVPQETAQGGELRSWCVTMGREMANHLDSLCVSKHALPPHHPSSRVTQSPGSGSTVI